MPPHPSASKAPPTTVSLWAAKPVLAGERPVTELHVRARETRRPSRGRGDRTVLRYVPGWIKGPGQGGWGGEPDDWTPESQHIAPPASAPSSFRSN